MATRIIPGVQVTVVKDVVTPQLAPSGVLGLVGLTEKVLENTERVSSWNRFIEVCGPASAHSMPEARQALANGVFELAIVPLKSTTAQNAEVTLSSCTLEARAPGIWANGFKLKISHRGDVKFDLEVLSPEDDLVEAHRNLEPKSFVDTLEKASAFVRVQQSPDSSQSPDSKDIILRPDEQPQEATLKGGVDASAKDYIDALEALREEADVDLVLAAVQDFSETQDVARIYSAVISHCDSMSADSKGRIGFGQVAPIVQTESESAEKKKTPSEAALAMGSTLFSDRFVLLSPHGVVGAVAGRVGALDYFQSPTFKNISASASLSRAIPLEEQGALLKGNVVPMVDQRGRGVIILRGITTDGDQISVRRIADRAVRGVKMLGELFIGRLNNEDGRVALKQKLIEFLVQMENDGALVASTDGKDPAFKIDVYSSQADFAQGIVRVDIAVRPVRSIDFIYATIFVQV